MKIATVAALVAVAGCESAVVARSATSPKAIASVDHTSMSATPINSASPPASATAASPTPVATEGDTGSSDLGDEVRQLKQAVDARRHDDPNRALMLCNDAALKFPNGVLSQEREIVAVDALTSLGRFADARTRAKKFEVDYPDAGYLPHVREIAGDR